MVAAHGNRPVALLRPPARGARRDHAVSDGTSPIVRRATGQDMAAVGRLAATLVRAHHAFDPLRFIPETPETAEHYGRFLASQLGKDDVVVLVAEHDARIVGYTYAGVEGYDYMALRGPAGVLYDLVVDPGHRRKGIGTALLEAAIDALGNLGAPRVLLFTAEKNQVAQAMFERANFRRTMIEMTREL